MKSAEWFRTWFDTDYYHLLYLNRDEKEARQFIDALLSFLKPSPGSTFIDIACGKGRHALQLAQSGFDTTGVDLSENSIQIAKESESNKLRFFVHDIRKSFPQPRYDFALNLFTSFGYFDSTIEHETALQNIFNLLNQDGTFVIDYLNTNAIRNESNSSNELVYNDIRFITNKSISGKHIIKSIKVIDGKEEHFFQEKVMAFGSDELIMLLEKVGFEIKSMHGNYQLDSYDSNQPRLIIIAQKK